MLITKRVHNAVRILLLLTKEWQKKPYDPALLPVTYLAAKLTLSATYIEQILSALKLKRIAKGKRGPHGGYALLQEPTWISLSSVSLAVLPTTEKSLSLPLTLLLIDELSISLDYIYKEYVVKNEDERLLS